MPIGGGVSTQSGGVRVGTMVFAAHGNDPGVNVGDYLECNGQNVSRATYANLFAAIGITWGAGDGVSTFTLPDARRRVPVGKGGAGTGTLGNAVGNTGGAETHSLVTGELAAHTHGAGSYVVPVSMQANLAASGVGEFVPISSNTAVSGTSGSTGSGTAHNNMQPSYVCGVWIKT